MFIRKVQPGLVWIQYSNLCIHRRVDDLAEELDVTPTTIYRWCRGERVPKTVQLAFQHLLGVIYHPSWNGVHVGEDGKLWTVNGRGINPAALEAWELVYQTNTALFSAKKPKTSHQPANTTAQEEVRRWLTRGRSLPAQRACRMG